MFYTACGIPSSSKLFSSLFSTSADSRRSIYHQNTCLDVEKEENPIIKFELSIIVVIAEKFAAILRKRERDREREIERERERERERGGRGGGGRNHSLEILKSFITIIIVTSIISTLT